MDILTTIPGRAQPRGTVPVLAQPVSVNTLDALTYYCISLLTHAENGQVDGWRRERDGTLTLFYAAHLHPDGDVQDLDEPCMFAEGLSAMIDGIFQGIPTRGLRLVPATALERRDGLLCRITPV